MTRTIAGVEIPETALACAASDYVRTLEPALLFRHAMRAFVFAVLTGRRDGLRFDTEMLLVAALFHSVGLHARYDRSSNRHEIDSANEARAFLRRHRIDEAVITEVWNAVALHTTPGLSDHMSALVWLMRAGVQMDLCGEQFEAFTNDERAEIVQAFPREYGFKHQIIEVYARATQYRPETTFGTVGADVLDRWDPNYRRLNFCGQILGSAWPN